MTKQALGIAVAILAERIERIYEDNEGFDGEITPEQLADMALQSFVPAKAPAPVIKAKSPIAGKVCNHCNQDGLKWGKHESRWTLYNGDGSRHLCRRIARQKAESQTETTFTEALKKV
jgi:hypothetical protein